MSSFTENVISPESRLLSAVDSISRDPKPSASEYLELYNPIPSVNSAPLSGFPDTFLSNSRSGVLPPDFQSDGDNVDNFNGHPDPSGTATDARNTSISYTDESFAENPDSSLLSWKKCSSELQSRNQINPGSHVVRTQMMGLRGEDFGYQMGPVPNFYVQPNAPINSNNMENPVGPMFPVEITSSSWCPVSWADPSLGPSSDRKGVEWAKSLQDSAGVDSLFQRSEFERSWRNRTSSDGGGMSPHKNPPILRSGQSASEASTSNVQQNRNLHHRRRGRTASASSTSSVDSPTNVTARDESRSINLPSGQSVNTADFGVATCLPDAVARMSFVADPSTIQRPIPASESSVLGQALSAADKPRLIAHQTQPNFWSASSTSQEAVPCSGVNSVVFSQKTDSYHRPTTSNQYTQHDALGAFRSKTAGYSKISGAFGYNGDGLDPGQQAGGTGSGALSDDQLWYYEDPQGHIQGEFSSAQMLNWFLAGRYFTSSLRIRRKCDDTFSTLHNYAQLFGHVPFAGTTQIPPIRGGITPQLILMVRMHDQQNVANLPFACLDQQQLLHKLSRSMTGDGGCVVNASGGFGKNGMSCSNVAAVAGQAFLLKQLTEMIASNPGAVAMNFNNPLFSFLSELISKARLDPSLLQEVSSTAAFTNPGLGIPWAPPPPSQSQLLSQQLQQQQQQLSARQCMDGVFLASTSAVTDPGSGGFVNAVTRGDKTAEPPSSDENTPFQSVSGLSADNHLPKATRHKSAGGRSSDGGASKSEVKSKQNTNAVITSKKSSQKQKNSPTGSKSDGADDNSGSQQSQRAVSQSGCSSCSTSSGCGGGSALSNESLQFNSISVGGRRLVSASEQPQPMTTKLTKSCWIEKAATLARTAAKGEANKSAKQSSLSSSAISPLSGSAGKSAIPNSSPATPPLKWVSQIPLSEGSGSTKKKAKSRQQQEQIQQVTVQNGVKKSGHNGTVSSKKSKGSENDNSVLTDELNTLICWVQSALMGFELREKVDIPTLVELLTTIDAPYEVESMLVPYLGSSPRSEQFVREFLDRRHTCWQLHRKRVEEMQSDSRLKRSQNDHQPSSAPTNNESNVYSSNAYSEANDSHAESVWQQIKPKNSSSRRGKKGGKHRS
ncbi:PERQ amino acid-rich with GYF domain-containing protein 2 [Echinococcus granulosus]|uniref:PERQ amino acid-rich with GYF domain-containing protein 2 n=1 Tax=Echinococcus granulosus TaxID=6210 RepID=W6UUP1_ECHGR|nr:PERQ amino acid-rich with GYF domain-containing protein 2 [Echinococcus granulosus]EUB62087.1 PERQ amino acid-rich with GYF domain-containing protein 2 [Echinococcus granulosus]